MQKTKQTHKQAIKILREAFEADPHFAHVWHCNIACPIMDAGASHEVANDAASRIMKLLFNIETNK
jgi:dihydroorotate dehydrogenase